MAEAPTQDGRIGKLATPLGKDKLCLTRFDGSEAISELFEYRIEAVSTDANISFRTALGKTCSVHLETSDHAGRDFSGILTEAKWIGQAAVSFRRIKSLSRRLPGPVRWRRTRRSWWPPAAIRSALCQEWSRARKPVSASRAGGEPTVIGLAAPPQWRSSP